MRLPLFEGDNIWYQAFVQKSYTTLSSKHRACCVLVQKDIKTLQISVTISCRCGQLMIVSTIIQTWHKIIQWHKSIFVHFVIHAESLQA